jgi:predicted nucleic acid-binding protein
VAPPLLPFEVTDVCWQHVRRGAVTQDEGIMALERFFALSIPLRPLSGGARRRLHTTAFAIAGRRGLSATYDAHYLALAEQLNCDLWTADLRLLRSLGPNRDRVRALDEYVPEPPPRA